MNKKIKDAAVDIWVIYDTQLVSAGGPFTLKTVPENSYLGELITRLAFDWYVQDILTPPPKDLWGLIKTVLMKSNTYLYVHNCFFFKNLWGLVVLTE